jgi:hypothetical protein
LLARVQTPFIENRGQFDSRVAFSAQLPSGAFFVSREGKISYALRPGSESPDESARPGSQLTELLAGGKARPIAGRRTLTRVSYFIGSDPKMWRSDLPTYEEVRLGEVWKGVHVSLHARRAGIEEVFTVAPFARPENIRIQL